jgi:ATP-binding cassette subfamily C protein CydC
MQAGSFNYMTPGAMIRFLAMTRTAGRYAERLQSHHTVLSLLKTLRLQSFQRLSAQSTQALSLLVKPGSADQLQRLVADIDLLDQFPLRVVLPWSWAVFIAGCYLLAVQWFMPSLTVSLCAGLCLLVFGWPLLMQRVGIRLARHDVMLQSQRRQLLLESMQLLTTLLMYGHWHRQQQQLAHLDEQIVQQQQQLHSAMLLSQLILQCLLLAGLVWIAWQATPLMLQGELAAAVLVGLLLGWLAMAEVMAPLAHLQTALGYSMAANDRMNQLLVAPAAEPTSAHQSAHQSAAQSSAPLIQTLPATALTAACSLSLHDLEIGFQSKLGQVKPQQQAFHAGDCVLLTAPSGAGKSCLLFTLAGDLAAHAGHIRVNGMDIQQLPASQRHQYIGVLPQRPHLFQLTIAADLRLANANASDTELLTVLELVGLTDWLQQQTMGLQTVLGQYGVGLSGGELRRFALARQLLQRNPILLLDEPFAGLDQAIADSLLSRLAQWQQHGILLIASHQQHQHPAFTKHWVLA